MIQRPDHAAFVELGEVVTEGGQTDRGTDGRMGGRTAGQVDRRKALVVGTGCVPV